jgi:flavin-dependent dehydrogenase
VTVDRAAFDFWLVEAAVRAGARLRDDERLVRLIRLPDSVLAVTSRGSHRARAAIGCDGVNSVVARSVRTHAGPAPAVLTACAEVAAADTAIAACTGGGLRVEYGAGPVGYTWAMPKRGRVNIGLGAPAVAGRELARRLAAFAAQHGLPEPKPRFHLVPLGHQRSPVVADNVLLAGDAAALADPFTGEGMRYALASGRLAGAVLSDTLSRGLEPNRLNLAAYSALCDAWRAEFRAAWRLTALIGRRPRLVQRLAFDNPEVFQSLLDLADGSRTHRQLWNGLITRSPILAAGSLRATLVSRRRTGEAGV